MKETYRLIIRATNPGRSVYLNGRLIGGPGGDGSTAAEFVVSRREIMNAIGAGEYQIELPLRGEIG